MARKRKVVWAVEDGSYSDYHVVGVFSTKANAEMISDLVKADGGVVEWEIDPAVADIRRGHILWSVLMLRDGTTEKVERKDPGTFDLQREYSVWRRSKAPAYAGSGVPDVLQAQVWARTERQAVKAVNEIRIQMIAEGEWK